MAEGWHFDEPAPPARYLKPRRASNIPPFKTIKGASIDRWMVIGEVIDARIDPAYLVNEILDTAAPIMRCDYHTDYISPKRRLFADAPQTSTRPRATSNIGLRARASG